MDWISLSSVMLISGALGAFLAQISSHRASRGLQSPGQKQHPSVQRLKRIMVTYINKDDGLHYYYDGKNELEAKLAWQRGLATVAIKGGSVEFIDNGIVRDRKSSV